MAPATPSAVSIELVAEDFRLAAGVLAGGLDRFGGEGDRLLPDLEITNAGCHGSNVDANLLRTSTER